ALRCRRVCLSAVSASPCDSLHQGLVPRDLDMLAQDLLDFRFIVTAKDLSPFPHAHPMHFARQYTLLEGLDLRMDNAIDFGKVRVQAIRKFGHQFLYTELVVRFMGIRLEGSPP